LRIRKTTKLLAGALFAVALACGLSLLEAPEPLPRDAQRDMMPAPSEPSEPILGPYGEEIVFQVHQVSWARVSQGFFINARGEVWRFDSFDTPQQVRYPLALPPNPRHADLLKSFGAHPQMVVTLPAAVLDEYRALAQAARNAPLVCIEPADDAVGTGYLAWVMNGDGAYSCIKLGGDSSCRSLSPAGEQVTAWLRTLTGMGSRVLRPPGRTCRARPCKGGRECFSVTYCEYVPDCSWCNGSTTCVEGTVGRKHCSTPYDPQCKDSPCACLGDAICPGAKGDCREATGGALTCQYP
jgi:hypothetical protein